MKRLLALLALAACSSPAEPPQVCWKRGEPFMYVTEKDSAGRVVRYDTLPAGKDFCLRGR